VRPQPELAAADVVVVVMGATCLFAKAWLIFLIGLMYYMGVGVTAADATMKMDSFYQCYIDTYEICQNKTFQSSVYPYLLGPNRRKCGRIAKPSDSKCGAWTDYTNWTGSGNAFDYGCLLSGGTFRAHDMHLYCGHDFTYHDLNYPFCMAASCANVSDIELDRVILSVYFPFYLQDSQSHGFHCAISASPRTKGWWWRHYGWKWMILPLSLVSLGALLCWYRRQRAHVACNASSDSNIVDGEIVNEAAPTIGD
jgi:hypothetical protein